MIATAKAELIVDAVVEVLDQIDGTGTYDADLRGHVFVADQVTETSLQATPVVLVSFDAVDEGDGLRERAISIGIDVFVDADYAASRGVPLRSLLLRIHSDIEAAMYAARYSHQLLSHQTFQGSSLLRAEDGSAQNGLTMRFRCEYSEINEDEPEPDDPAPVPPLWWPNENTKRLHDGALRVQPVWLVNDGGRIVYCVSRAEMLTFAPELWHSLHCYVLRAPQDITPANLTGDTLLDRPEWGTPVYRNAAWDVLGPAPMDGITDPVFRTLAPNDVPAQLEKAGVRPIYIPRTGESDLLLGYGWLHQATTRHTLREEIVTGTDVNHTFHFGMSAGGSLVEWVVDDTAIGANRNIVNNANNGFGREIQVALYGFDHAEPPGPNDSGQQNPTQGGVAYGNKTGQNAMSPPEVHPLGAGFALESILACGSPVVSFTVTNEPLGGKSFDTLCCPVDFVSDRYEPSVNRETVYSRPGEYFLTNPIIWPTTLLRTRVWANYKGDDRVVRFDSWLDLAAEWTNPLNGYFPQMSAAFVSLNHDNSGWFNKLHVADPATDTLTEWTGQSDLWDMTPALRQFVIGQEGVYRLSPGPATRILDCPFTTRHAALIAESTDDDLCFGFYSNLADNTDSMRTQEFEVVSIPSPSPAPSSTAANYGLMVSSDTRHQHRETGQYGKPYKTPPGVYGPFTTYFVVGDLATVRAKIRALYLAGELP